MTPFKSTTKRNIIIYFLILRTGIRIDEPGRSTLSETSNNGNLRGIFMVVAILDFEISFQREI